MRYDHRHVIALSTGIGSLAPATNLIQTAVMTHATRRCAADQIPAFEYVAHHQLVKQGDRVPVLGIGLGLYPLLTVVSDETRKVQA